jgi:putative endopeptidase
MPNIDFDVYLKRVGCQSIDTIVVSEPDALRQMDEIFMKTSIDQWVNYLSWCMINHYADLLDENFMKLNFSFYGTDMRGMTEMKPIDERCIDDLTGSPISELLGKAFVDVAYSDDAQKRVNKMVDNLLIVFRERIAKLDWMSDKTKGEAMKKLNSIGRKLGFPSKWKDFSGIDLTPNNFVQNIDNLSAYSVKDNFSKLNQPVDRSEWGMPAHLVNAYYHPLLNEIAFPAGIMQPPFFSNQYEDAVNYGRIGMVIGHEFTHGFDDQGAQFAADGSFTNWWTEEDLKLFSSKTTTLGETFSAFCPIDGHCVNAELTMGENIADLGGLTMAYYAYTLTDEFKKGEVINGYTPAQRFFIAYAQLWKINYTDAEMKNRIATDPHSPGMYRVNGPLKNCPEFFEAFNVKEGDKMRNPKDKIAKIW